MIQEIKEARWRGGILSPNTVLRKSVFRDPFPLLGDKGEDRLRQFVKYGYLVIPNVLSTDEVLALRTICDRFDVERDKQQEMLASQFLSIKELAVIPFQNSIVGILQSIFGHNYTTYPSMVVRTDTYVDWHADNGFLPQAHPDRYEHLHDPNFLHSRCTIYLQDNDENSGGGIDLVPGSVRNITNFGGRISPIKYMGRTFNLMRKPISLKTKAGDLLLLDPRAQHRATRAKISPKERRHGIFWDTSRTDAIQVNRFMTFLVNHTGSLKDSGRKGIAIDRYSEAANITYPDSYPDVVVELVKSQGLNIASADVLDLPTVKHEVGW